ncbi:hypothetical protein GRI62_10200 [Erythrobacter arachoides]|uniref:Uncharacterized protein n=1 Tax=Aurantiacibacter arachoides TaxID=1850444 RepID=A0A845A0B3_9SPHN|nr:hypothetical protein [Aurantiacibacter arachoides]MXO93971.1 hypothetical protein [Aurantiacibacter arachoides]GGD45156.1 hypothetical protein GCM10011411_00960 [Aurantiacibacter arachoides]
MSEVRNGEIHIDSEDASGGSKEGVVRWVLLISILAAVLILSIIWMAGAFSQNEDESSATYEPATATEQGAIIGDTDSNLAADSMTDMADDSSVQDGLPVTENE